MASLETVSVEGSEADPMITVRLLGSDAIHAWRGYQRNSAHFPPEDRAYAATLDEPNVILLRLLPSVLHEWVEDLRSSSSRAKRLGSSAAAILLLGALHQHHRTTLVKHRVILYVHTRTAFLGDGHGTILVRAAQLQVPVGGQLVTQAAPCRTWYATLLLLRSGFWADAALGEMDIAMPGEKPKSKNARVDFSWTRMPLVALEQEAKDHLAFVQRVQIKQRRRASGRRYADALTRVIEALEAKIGQQPEPPANPAGPSMQQTAPATFRPLMRQPAAAAPVAVARPQASEPPPLQPDAPKQLKKRPCGRPPANKIWDSEKGMYVASCALLAEAPATAPAAAPGPSRLLRGATPMAQVAAPKQSELPRGPDGGIDTCCSAAAAALEGQWVRMDDVEGLVQRVRGQNGRPAEFWVCGMRWAKLDPRRAVVIDPSRISKRACRRE
jgi:hypothetical protein